MAFHGWDGDAEKLTSFKIVPAISKPGTGFGSVRGSCQNSSPDVKAVAATLITW